MFMRSLTYKMMNFILDGKTDSIQMQKKNDSISNVTKT